jgi:threonine/homoserine/homoserine lactone efflux protein
VTLPVGVFLTVWSILALNILSPGPTVLNTITTAMGSGRPAGLSAAVAVGLGSGLWCLGMSLGMAAVFALVPGSREALTLMAAGLLVYFAVRYLRAAFFVEIREAQLRARGGQNLAASFARSFSIVASNPKALTTWLAILGIFPVAGAAPADVAVLTAGAAAISAAIHTGYALVFSMPPAAVLYLRAAPVINGLVGVFFTGFAVKLVAPLLASL